MTSKVRNNMSQSPMCVADAQSIQGQGLLRSDSGANSENEAPEGRYAAITARWALDRPNVDLALECGAQEPPASRMLVTHVAKHENATDTVSVELVRRGQPSLWLRHGGIGVAGASAWRSC